MEKTYLARINEHIIEEFEDVCSKRGEDYHQIVETLMKKYILEAENERILSEHKPKAKALIKKIYEYTVLAIEEKEEQGENIRQKFWNKVDSLYFHVKQEEEKVHKMINYELDQMETGNEGSDLKDGASEPSVHHLALAALLSLAPLTNILKRLSINKKYCLRYYDYFSTARQARDICYEYRCDDFETAFDMLSKEDRSLNIGSDLRLSSHYIGRLESEYGLDALLAERMRRLYIGYERFKRMEKAERRRMDEQEKERALTEKECYEPLETDDFCMYCGGATLFCDCENNVD